MSARTGTTQIFLGRYHANSEEVILRVNDPVIDRVLGATGFGSGKVQELSLHLCNGELVEVVLCLDHFHRRFAFLRVAAVSVSKAHLLERHRRGLLESAVGLGARRRDGVGQLTDADLKLVEGRGHRTNVCNPGEAALAAAAAAAAAAA
eukprot:CAMPEP_0115646248 /NCGR_PEP_ID=MMETSP0272-20121206/38830_1 /TAXON_ID=71861 /ORGANISM="Scrippsiella trochoidea, Strain CCMP3099" /LENGTH=148 /DNA_ID=CAMNT_0003083765 /DNA_START=194 /DNA_END=636 /DNA_ORIENTATION=-